MVNRLIEKSYDSAVISAPGKSASVDLGGVGGDSIAYQLVVSAVSTPNTANITLEGSLDNTNFVSIGSAVNVTTTGSYALTADRPAFRYYRVSYAIASGSYTAILKVLVKGDRA